MVELPDVHIDPGVPEPDLLVGPPEAAQSFGPATVDSDADGRPDTAVVSEPGDPGALTLATDLDGDARIDVLTRVHADGTATTELLDDLGEAAAAPWDEGPVPPPPTIDPASGRWVRDGAGG
ncbi:hypothetical protein ACQPX6_29285 [Actinomycetospora sp. CA-101289]|uniref:hypothetical protein n=1 Tax=Actinomycetospora sp. CA-101289 TaxID=3239893 RepID=UPI003D985569